MSGVDSLDATELLTLMDRNLVAVYATDTRATPGGEVVETESLVLCRTPHGTVSTNMAIVTARSSRRRFVASPPRYTDEATARSRCGHGSTPTGRSSPRSSDAGSTRSIASRAWYSFPATRRPRGRRPTP